MHIITLMTDFGLKDGNVGVMKGVILGISPQAQIVDISHLVQPQDILEAGLILRRSAPYFPSGTIHVVVVDPGVGTQRRPLAAWIGNQIYVGPDNGLITMLVEYGRARNWEMGFVHLDKPATWLEPVSHVFHGRDIFAPAGGHLASGMPLLALGSRITDPLRLSLPRPDVTPEGWLGQIIHIDHFGNLSTNLRAEDLGECNSLSIHLREAESVVLFLFLDRAAGTAFDAVLVIFAVGGLFFLDFFLSKDRDYGTSLIPELECEHLVCFSSMKEACDRMQRAAMQESRERIRHVHSVQKLKASVENPELARLLAGIFGTPPRAHRRRGAPR